MPGPKATGHSPREVVDQAERANSRYVQSQATANSETDPEFSRRMSVKAKEQKDLAASIRNAADPARRPTGQFVSSKRHPATRHIK